MNKCISVLMSVYEEDNSILSKCIQSILNQTFKDFEFIIINDGITAKNRDVLSRFEKNDKRIKVVNNDTNIGLTKSLNKALGISCGKYIARIDSDDYCRKDRLQIQKEFLDQNEQYVICGSSSKEVSDGKIKEQRSRLVLNDNEIRKVMIYMNPFIHSSLMIRAEVLSNLGGYNESFRYAQDYQLIYQLSKFGMMKNLADCLVWRHVSTRQISNKNAVAQLLSSIRTRLIILKEFRYPLVLNLKLILYLFRSLLKLFYLKLKEL